MIQELEECALEKGFGYLFRGHTARLEEMLKDYRLHYFLLMSIPSDRARTMSMRNTMRWIYELWILKQMC